MDIYYCDSSSIAKRYLQEVGSPWVRQIVDPAAGNVIYLASITCVEIVSAIVRRERGGGLALPDALRFIADFHYDLANQYRQVDLDASIMGRAMTLAETYALRGYDAVQLAAALSVNADFQGQGSSFYFICADAELNAAARAEGLAVDDPNLHP